MKKKEKNSVAKQVHDFFISLCINIVRPRYQILSSILFVTFLFFAFNRAYQAVFILEKRPSVYSIDEHDKSYSRAARVEVGFHINDFSVFNIRENDFTFNAKVWFLFDRSMTSLEDVEKFAFTRGNITHQILEETKVIDGKFFAQYGVKVAFKADLNQKYFPFDDHRIYIELINTHATPEEIIFSADTSSFLIPKELLLIGWHPVDRQVETGFNKSVLDRFDSQKNSTHPSALFSIDFSRAGVQNIFLIFLPLFLMIFISFFALSLNPGVSRSSMFNLALTAVTGLMGYRFVLQGLMPRVSYFLLSDCFFLLLLGVAFFVFCASLMIVKAGKLTNAILVLRGSVFIISYLILIVFSIYFLFYWV